MRSQATLPVSTTTAGGTTFVAAGQGRPLVFVHGVGMNHAVWTPQFAHFRERYHVLAYDLLGHGGSPLPEPSVTLASLGDQLAELLDDREIERACLVGHSMGALVALDFALRFSGRVDHLVVMNAVHERSEAQREAVRSRANRLEAAGVRDTVRETLERWFGEHGSDERDAVGAVRDWLDAVDPVGYARVYRLFADADRAFSDRLAELEPRTLFLTGELDPNSTPAMSRTMASLAPNAEAAVLSGQRHMMSLVAPEQVNPVLDAFLGDQEAVTELRAGDRSVRGR